MERNLKILDVPDPTILSHIDIHYRKCDTFFWGFSFFDKQNQCILKVGDTCQNQHRGVHSVSICENDVLIGLKSNTLSSDDLYCYDMKLVIARLID